MADEENLRFLRRVPWIIIYGVGVSMCIIISREMVVINGVPVPVMCKDSQKLFQCGIIFWSLAFLASYVAGIMSEECVVTGVCRWLGIMFFLSGLGSFFICTLLSADISLLRGSTQVGLVDGKSSRHNDMEYLFLRFSLLSCLVFSTLFSFHLETVLIKIS